MSLLHPKSCQGDRQTRQPSQHNGLNWNEAEIGDPSADSWVYSAGAGLWPGETLAVTPSPSWGSPTSGINSGVHLLPPKRRTRPANQDGSDNSNLLSALPPCTTRTTKGRRTRADPSPKPNKERNAPRCPRRGQGDRQDPACESLPPQQEPLKAGEQDLGVQVVLGRCLRMHDTGHCRGSAWDRITVPVFREELEAVWVRSALRPSNRPRFATGSRGCGRAG